VEGIFVESLEVMEMYGGNADRHDGTLTVH
jgi:hypothetical protein